MGAIRHYVRPKSLEEATAVLMESGGKACVLAGGTSLTLRQPPGVDTLVDLAHLGLTGVEDRKDVLAIKACTRLCDLAEMPQLQDAYEGVIGRAVRRVASAPLRNLITLGGNLVQVLPWSDLPGVFLALDASLVIEGPNPRTMEARDFYAAHPRTFFDNGDIVTEVLLPKPGPGERVGTAFFKIGKTRFDYAALSVTAVCRLAENKVRTCAVSLGSVRPLPLRVAQAEEEMVGRAPGYDDIVRAAARAAGAVEPSQDFRYGVDYRRHLIKVWVKRSLQTALS